MRGVLGLPRFGTLFHRPQTVENTHSLPVNRIVKFRTEEGGIVEIVMINGGGTILSEIRADGRILNPVYGHLGGPEK